jgi:hypothetical protein
MYACMHVWMYVCMYPVQVTRFHSFSTNVKQLLFLRVQWDVLRASPPTLRLSPFENISDIQVLVTYFFSTTPIKLKLGLQVRWYTTQNSSWDWKWVSNPLRPIKLSTQSETESCQWIRFHCVYCTDPWWLWKLGLFSESQKSSSGFSLDLNHEPHPRFLVQAHILSTGGDALMADALMALYPSGVWVF